MKKGLLVVMAAGALVCASMAFAAPRALSSTELDTVAAGTGATQTFIDAFLGSPTESVPVVDGENSAEVDESDASIAVNGNDNATAGAIADNDGIATNGDGNVNVDVDIPLVDNTVALGDSFIGNHNRVTTVDQEDATYAVNTGDNTEICIDYQNNYVNDVDCGSAVVIGDCNEVCIVNDYSEVYGKIGSSNIESPGASQIIGTYYGSYGVVAAVAEITDSFNVCETETCIEVDIEDSFNVTNKKLDICGQNELTAIVNANALGEQEIGANLNITTATAAAPGGNEQTLLSGEIPLASAITVLTQMNLNNSDFDNIEF